MKRSTMGMVAGGAALAVTGIFAAASNGAFAELNKPLVFPQATVRGIEANGFQANSALSCAKDGRSASVLILGMAWIGTEYRQDGKPVLDHVMMSGNKSLMGLDGLQSAEKAASQFCNGEGIKSPDLYM